MKSILDVWCKASFFHKFFVFGIFTGFLIISMIDFLGTTDFAFTSYLPDDQFFSVQHDKFSSLDSINNKNDEYSGPTSIIEQDDTEYIYVHVSGAVLNPGVYRLASSARVLEAVECAKPNSDANIHTLNLAAILYDGQKIIVPSIDSDHSVQKTENEIFYESFDSFSDKININFDDVNRLMSLPGIGEAKAQAIVAYRTQHGSFHTIEEICKVNGIGESIYDKIKDKIVV